MLAGGVVFVGSLAAVAAAHSFGVLMLALIAFFPASGAFVSLTQAALMDAAPGRQQQRMAAWNLAGSAGAVGGPLLLAGVLAAGGNWRAAYLLLAAAAGAALARRGGRRACPAGIALSPAEARHRRRGPQAIAIRDGARRAAHRAVTARWLLFCSKSATCSWTCSPGTSGVYLVDVAHASPAEAAVGVAVRLGGGLAGDALFVAIARRVSGPAVLRVSAVAAGLLYPAFLLVPSLPAKLVILAVLSVATACWYPVIQSGLYVSLPGRSDIAVFLSSAAGLLGAAGPLAVGFVAQQAGLAWALAGLAAAPAVVLAVLPRGGRAGSRKVLR